MDNSLNPILAFQQSLTAAVLLRVADGVLIGFNPAAERLLGYSSTEVQGRTAGEVGLWPDPLEQARVWSQVGEDGSGRDVDLHLRVAQGETVSLRMDCQAMQWRGVAHLLCFLHPSVVAVANEEEPIAEAPTAEPDDPHERALRQSEALYQALVDSCRDGVFLVQHGRLQFANQALADMLGRPLERLVGMDYIDLVHPEDRTAQIERRRKRESGSTDSQRYRVRLLRGDGSSRVFEVHASAVRYRDEPASTGVMRDVTDESKQQTALREAEQRYRDLFENAPIGLFRTHADGRILAINPSLLELIGFESMEALRVAGWTMRDVYVHPDQRNQLMGKLATQGQVENEELEIRHRDGGSRWVNCMIRQVRSAEGEVEFAGAVRDITARRQAELALKHSESKYRVLVEQAQVGVFIARGEHLCYVNSNLCRLLGYSEASLLGKPLSELMPPDVLPATLRRWQRVVDEGRAQQEIESCLLRSNGARVWVTESIDRIELDGEWHVAGTLRDVTRQREIERRLRFHASHDPLTGLPNRLDFQQRLNEVMLEARAGGRHDYAVLFLDLDGFKLINDSQGHAAGDRLLVNLAARITDVLAGEALVARYGGDEFTVLPFGSCDRERAVRLAESLLRVFDAPISSGPEQVFSSASVGIVLGMPGYRDSTDVLRDADTAMYRAKAAGRCGWAVFDDAMRTAAQHRFQLEVEMRAGIDKGEFDVFYQPIVDLSSGRIVACEALLRWHHPVRGLLLPADFLPVAEESGLIVRLDSFVLDRACRDARGWQSDLNGAGDVRVNINVNDRHANSSRYPLEVEAVLNRHGLAAHCLRLEITETAFRNGRQNVTPLLHRLKAIGCGLVVDDFGTGYSSLDSFASAPFDALKIDRSFVADMVSNAKHRAIVRTIIGFAADLGLSLTAEGIESEGQEACLRSFGCATAQGFRFGQAMPLAAWRSRIGVRNEAPRVA